MDMNTIFYYAHYISGPAVGAIIGYFTNYIAVKMLFRPLRPLKIFGRELRFTQGVIPRRREALASAIGRAVGETLFTAEDINALLLSEPVKQAALGKIISAIKENDTSARQIIEKYTGEEKYEIAEQIVEDKIFDKVMAAIDGIDLKTIIIESGGKAVKQRVRGMLAMFLNENTVADYAEPIAAELKNYINTNGKRIIRPVIHSEVSAAASRPLGEAAESVSLENEVVFQALDDAYTALMQSFASTAVEKLCVSGSVEQKISEMDVLEIEKLCLSVMKKELNTIVSLGAVIGLIIGFLTLLF